MIRVSANIAPFMLEVGNPSTGAQGWGRLVFDRHINSDINSENVSIVGFRIGKSIAGRLVADRLDGDFQFKTTGRLFFSPETATEEAMTYLSDIQNEPLLREQTYAIYIEN